jgi:ABC-type transport system involved in multi-copper enzyme maturation permease subunit
MAILTIPAQRGQDSGLRPVPWRRMAWVTWRQHRATLISVPAVLGAVAVFLLIAGLKIHHDYAALTACHPFASNACQELNSNFNGVDWTMGNTLNLFVNLTPALLGAFAGAPVLARELETGTFRYAWTQGFGRERWTIAKLVLLAAAVAAMAGAFSELFAWFFQPFIAQESLTVLSATVFAVRPVAFAAWTLVAFAIGACAGMLIRRIVPAMAVTLGVYAGLDILTWLFLRARYPVALVTSNPSLFNPVSNPGTLSTTANMPWVLSTWFTGRGGASANQSVVNQVLGQYQNGKTPPAMSPAQALAQHGITQWWRYIPVSRFWPMQFFEAGWLLVLSVLLVTATIWLVRRRAA